MSKQYDSRTVDKFVVRLPDGLRAQVELSAGTSDTSMNTVFIQALRQYLDNQGRQQVLLDALAAAYVRAGEREQELLFQIKDREGSRRDWFEAAQAAEKRVEELEELLAGAVNAWEAAQFGDPPVALSKVMARAKAALSDSAEPSVLVERDERADFEADHERRWPLPVDAGPATQYDHKQRKALRLEGWQARAALDKATEGTSHE